MAKPAKNEKLFTRRNFFRESSAALAVMGAIGVSCTKPDNSSSHKDNSLVDPNPSSWWHKDGYALQKTVDTSQLSRGTIRAYIEGSWREFTIKKLPDRFIEWSMRTRVARLGRMIRFGGMDPRDLAGSHNACVATYGGPPRDSAISLNTAYKGMGFTIHPDKIAAITKKIKEERDRIERDLGSDPMKAMQAKVHFLMKFYQDTSYLDPTKQVSLELFAAPDYHTHTFLNMMNNPIASASFLAFPTYEIRAVPQLLHPRNPGLSQYEKNLITYTNAIHDFIHAGSGDRMTCVYHVIDLFDDTPNDECKGRRIT